MGIAMVVSLPMPIFDSRRPLMEDPMTESRAGPAVAGPYMYFTVANPLFLKYCKVIEYNNKFLQGLVTFNFRNYNTNSAFRADARRVITLHIHPIPNVATDYIQ
jgi:hypothetical protein